MADPDPPVPRKVAIFMAYLGHGYLGMQRNPNAKTIESDLENALRLSSAISPSAKLHKDNFSRCARTDKGVSAVGQVVSGLFSFADPSTLVETLNTHLPPQIRVFGVCIVPDFDAKKCCDQRRYVYLLPLFALDTFQHRDRESVIGSGGVLRKCMECSERGRKKGIDAQIPIVPSASTCKIASLSTQTERFNGILHRYVGLHNFHNMTTRINPDDPAAVRHIISIDATIVIDIDGMQFIKCVIVGKSFMLHQIRKMIGLAVAIVRDCAPESLLYLALRQDVKINVPTAPEVGLYLEECMFTAYNHDTTMSMAAYSKQAEDFKFKYIYNHIASMERRYGAVALWLHSLNSRNYPDFNFQLPSN